MPKTKTSAVAHMHADSEMIAALLGGEKTMRALGQKYLPQHAREHQDDYVRRLHTSVLFPALAETLSQMVGRVFFKPVGIDGVWEGLNQYLSNIDLQNNELNIFAANWFYDALAFGAGYVLADYSHTGSAQTLADSRANNARPYALHIPNQDVLGFRYEMRGGVPVCTQFRYRQRITEYDGEFGEQTLEQINVWEAGRVRRYRYGGAGLVLHEDIEIRGADGLLLDSVPVVDLVLEPTGFFVGKPPLLGLAHLNIKHWQMLSDYHNIVRFTSVPLLVYSGREPFGSKESTISPSNLIDLGEDGTFGYVEHSGAAIGSAVAALEQLKEDMAIAGAKLLTRTKLALTDSQARDEQGKEISKLRVYANRTEDAIGRMLDWFAIWLGHDGGGTVEISGNIDADFDPAASFAEVLKMQAAGVLSSQTVFEEAQSRSIISPQRQWQNEQQRIRLQGDLAMDFEADTIGAHDE